MQIKLLNYRQWLSTAATATLAGLTFSLAPVSVPTAAAAPATAISSTPLNVIIPSTPQVMIALTNSNSMDSSDKITDDGTPSPGAGTHAPTSAIMTWSGNVGGGSLSQSTSPVNYRLPGSYTAPITGATFGSTPYTAPLNTYTRSGINPGSWVCRHSDTDGIAVPNPGGNPPTYNWPASPPVPWDDTQTWWFNNIDIGGNNGYYEQPNPPPSATNYRLPDVRDVLDGNEALFARHEQGGLASVGMGDSDNSIKPKPRVGGGGTSGPSPPGPTPPVVCDLWQWDPAYSYTHSVTPYGDNSASRMNIAKQSIYQIIQTYGVQVDFGLMSYKVSGVTGYDSWAYYMSPAVGGFASGDFSNSYQPPAYMPGPTPSSPPVLSSQWVTNPCWNAAGSVTADCSAVAAQIGLPAGNAAGAIGSFQYLQVAASSDDPDVNDVLISGGGPSVFMANGTLTAPTLAPPANSSAPISSPYTTFTLSDYNLGESACGSGSNCVQVQYSATAPTVGFSGAYTLTPTNAGFVPYSPQVLFARRGYLWAGKPSFSAGDVRVPVNAAAGPTPALQAAYLAQFAPFLTPENNVPTDDSATVPGVTPTVSYSQYYNNAIVSSAIQSPMAGMLSTALSASTWPSVTTPTGCTPPKYVILITDGLPTEDLSGKTWPPPGSAAAVGYGMVTFNPDGTLNTGSNADQAVVDTINQITALNAAGIKTFVVGMGAGVDPALNPDAARVLNAMAAAGGTKNYYPGTSPAAVVSQLNAILAIINSTTVASVSGAVSSYALPGASVYQATYTGYDAPDQDWTGNLQAFAILANGNASTAPLWSGQSQLDGQNWDTGRNIVTCGSIPGGGCAPASGEPFRWSSLSTAQQAALALPTDPNGTYAQDRLNYLRGDTSNYAPAGDGFRPRSHILGDIVDSAPLFVGPSNGPYTNDPSYRSFVASTQTRPATIYVGANDGMLHAFNAATGKEVFAFIPNGVFANLAQLSNPAYNSNHHFYVDGSPTAGDVKFSDNSWHTVLAGGLNAGGNSIYALDITSPLSTPPPPDSESAIASTDVLWEFTDPHMGLSYSQPAFALTHDVASINANPNGFLLFFGSGYNNSDGNPYLYAVNPQTGQIVSKDVSQAGAPLGPINLCNAVTPSPCDPSLPNGLSGVTVVNNNGVIGAPDTTVYAGDLQGNLWKVDITNPDPKLWTVSLLFQACSGSPCSSSNRQPITVTPAVTLNPAFPSAPGTVVYFGTGEYLGIPDISSTNTQSFYAVLDNGTTAPVTRAQLVQQTLSASNEVIKGNSVTLRTVTNNPVNWSTQYGWFMDLPLPGERVVTNPRIFSGEVVFTTYVPSATSLCTGGGASYLMVLNYRTGGAFPLPQLDINGDGLLNGSDQLAGQNPVGLSLGDVYASAPTILSADMQSIMAVKLTTISTPNGQSNGNIVSLGEAGGTPAKLTWTQLQ